MNLFDGVPQKPRRFSLLTNRRAIGRSKDGEKVQEIEARLKSGIDRSEAKNVQGTRSPAWLSDTKSSNKKPERKSFY